MQYVECPAGYYNDNCSDICPLSYYGPRCAQKCDCLPCHHVYGCSSSPFKEGKTLSVHVSGITTHLRLVLYLFINTFFLIISIINQ